MSILSEALQPRARAAGWSDVDERWYVRDISGYVAAASGSGIAVTAETMLRCGTVLAAVRFRGDSWAMCPPTVYRHLERGRAEDSSHPVQELLRFPNKWQTGNRWRHLMGVWLATWGNAYSRIVPGRAYFAGELRPIHPSHMRLKNQRADGTLVYQYTGPEGQEELGGDAVVHFRDLGTDGFQGLEMYQLIRNVVGIALLAEQHASTFLRKGNRIAGLISPSAPLTPEQRKALKDSINADFSGPTATGTLGIMPHGVELKALASSNRDAQFLELTESVVGSILRFLGVPGVVVGYAKDTATYASAKEFFESGGIKHCVLPILTNVEAEEEKSLLLRGDGRFIRHNLDVLLRANLKDRYEAFSKALGGAPFLSVNDVRTTDDWNADPDPRHDEIRIPVNLGPPPAAEDPEAQDLEPAPRRWPAAPPPEDDDEDAAAAGPAAAGAAPPPAHAAPPQEDPAAQASAAPGTGAAGQEPATTPSVDQVALVSAEREVWRARTEQYARDNAERVVRRELAKVAERGRALARDHRAWRAWVLDYYERHAGHVAEVMRIAPDTARAYCDRQAAALLAHGAIGAATWESTVPPQLVALALAREEA